MKPVLLLILILSFVCNYNYRAQDNTAFEKETVVATAGYGAPDFYRISLRTAYNGYRGSSVSGFGPIIVKGDYGIAKFRWGHSVGAGIVLGYSSSQVQFTDYYSGAAPTVIEDYYQTITIGARCSYHFFTKEKIDCYANIGLGYNINLFSAGYSHPDGYYARSRHNRTIFYNAFTVGIRYYFTKNIGVHAEAGWDMSAPIQAGLAIKF